MKSIYILVPAEEEAAESMETMETKYTDIIIYACGFVALIMAIVIVVLCRMQVHPRREPFDALPVQKLSKFPLRRQVQHFVITVKEVRLYQFYTPTDLIWTFYLYWFNLYRYLNK